MAGTQKTLYQGVTDELSNDERSFLNFRLNCLNLYTALLSFLELEGLGVRITQPFSNLVQCV